MNAAAEMPRYRCHKVVWALEIKAFEWITNKPSGGWRVTPADIGYADIEVPAEVFARYTPELGDFLVQYDDGYWSVSPRKAFLEGYTPIAASDVHPVNASGWLDQRSQPDHAVQELRRWAIEMAIVASRAAGNTVDSAAKFEAYVLNGAPVKAAADTDDGR